MVYMTLVIIPDLCLNSFSYHTVKIIIKKDNKESRICKSETDVSQNEESDSALQKQHVFILFPLLMNIFNTKRFL